MILNIITEPNPILHQPSAAVPITDINSESIQKLIEDIVETMYANNGVGIAAPQIDSSLQICAIMKDFAKKKDKDIILINPRWEKTSPLKEWDEEGCLSVPKIYGQVKRYKKIKVDAFDAHGKQICFIAEGTLARIIQHEVDHLKGTLFIEKAKNLHSLQEETM